MRPSAILYAANAYRYEGGFRVDYDPEGFSRPSKCPVCSAPVFFVRHNGGSVWFDHLGWPWPKHGCFDAGRAERARAVVVDLAAALREAGAARRDALLGYVGHADAETTVEGRCYDFHATDDRVRRALLPSDLRVSTLVGRFVLLLPAASEVVLVHPLQHLRSIRFLAPSPARPRP